MRSGPKYKAQSDKKCHLYYCGDFDPSGLSIYDSIKKRIMDFGVSINFERIALTEDQIKEYRLPSDPAKQSDPNYNKPLLLSPVSDIPFFVPGIESCLPLSS